MTTRCALLAVLATLAGCSRPGPSPEYAAARQKHAAAVAAYPSDAATRPEIEEVLQLLDRVPPDSPDAPAARELRERIRAERTAAAEAAARRSAAVEKAAESPAWTSAAPAAPAPARIAVGTTLDDLRGAHGACLEPRAGDARIARPDGTDQPAQAWVVKADEECRRDYAAYLDKVVLVASGAVVAVRPASEGVAVNVSQETVVRREAQRDVELVQLPGGGWGMRGPDGKVVPLPEDAKVRTPDGKPLQTAPAGASK